MMKTSVFALAQRGPDSGEGPGRDRGGSAHERHLPSLPGKGVRSQHNAGCRSPPGEGRHQQVGVCAGETTLLGGQPWLCSGNFATPSCLSVLNKEIFPWRLLWGRGKKKKRGRQRMNSQVGKEGGKGEGRGSWFADSKICGSCRLKSPRTKKPLPSSRLVLPPTSSLSCYGCFVQ